MEECRKSMSLKLVTSQPESRNHKSFVRSSGDWYSLEECWIEWMLTRRRLLGILPAGIGMRVQQHEPWCVLCGP